MSPSLQNRRRLLANVSLVAVLLIALVAMVLALAVGADRSGWTPSEASLPSDAEYPTEVAPSDSVISRPRHRRQPRRTQEGRRETAPPRDMHAFDLDDRIPR
jgi:hypothetical protein